MSLNNIQLTAETTSILFSKNLVCPDVFAPLRDEKESIKIASLGENQKHILFLTKDVQYKFLPDSEMELLTNLVSACQLSMADIVLVNFHSNPLNYQQFNEYFEPKKVLLFGISTSDVELPFTIPFFQIQKFNAQEYLTAPALKDFLENKNLKKELWKSLQKLFQLS